MHLQILLGKIKVCPNPFADKTNRILPGWKEGIYIFLKETDSTNAFTTLVHIGSSFGHIPYVSQIYLVMPCEDGSSIRFFLLTKFHLNLTNVM